MKNIKTVGFMIYFIDTYKSSFLEKGKYSAMSKPRADIIKIFCSFDEISFLSIKSRINNNSSIFIRIINNIRMLISAVRKCFKIKNAKIFFQYPFTDGIMMIIVFWLKWIRHCKIFVVIHDIESIRQNKIVRRDLMLFKETDILIVHSLQMAKKIREMGYKGQFRILEFFDYLNDFIPNDSLNASERVKVIFAGNLIKSKFIKRLNEIKTSEQFQFNLYGKNIDYRNLAYGINYKGYFEANNIKNLEGNWGLVWDGDSIDSCTGELGEYLKYNAPFKFSLYLAAGIPVIVWNQSAMAQYVKIYNIGITISSLTEIETKIKSLSYQQLTKIKEAVRQQSENLRNGVKFKSVYKSIVFH